MPRSAADPPAKIPTPIVIGEAIRARRVALGLRPEDVAAHAKLSMSTVQRIERGGDTTLGTLLAIADALSTTVADLLGGEAA